MTGNSQEPVETVDQRRRPRRQWPLIVISAAAVAAALAGGLTLVDHASARTQSPALAAADTPASVTAPTSATASTSTSTTASTSTPGPQSPVTPAALVYRLQQLLPAGQTSGFAADGLLAQLYLDQGHGPGMLRLAVAHQPSGRPDCGSSAAVQVTCEHLSDGDLAVVQRIPSNCVQSMTVMVDHPDGTEVQLMVSTCLAWNGKANPPCAPALTAAQAVAITDDPGWGMTMSSSLVAAAQQKFPSLPAIS